MGNCFSSSAVKGDAFTTLAGNSDLPKNKENSPQSPVALTDKIPSRVQFGVLSGASHALSDLLEQNNNGDGVAIVATRWKSVTGKDNGTNTEPDGLATMHGARTSTSSLEALGVNLDNGLSHLQDVKEIVDTGFLLGTGSFGSVFKGDIQGIPVAVKVLRYREVESIRDELLASMSLTHINLVQTYMAFQHKVVHEDRSAPLTADDPFAEMMAIDVWNARSQGPEDGPHNTDWELTMHEEFEIENEDIFECYIVQEYANLGNLQNLIEDGCISGSKFLKRCLMMALDMARGLAYMHSFKILHLDLKPQNILLSRKKGERPVCKIADFGLSRAMATDMATVNTLRCGTAVYAPLEMVMDGRVSPTADVYSLAIMIGEMLTGKLLYSDISMAQAVVAVVHNGMRPTLDNWVPESLRLLLEAAWSSDRRKRPTAKTVAATIRAIIKGLP